MPSIHTRTVAFLHGHQRTTHTHHFTERHYIAQITSHTRHVERESGSTSRSVGRPARGGIASRTKVQANACIGSHTNINVYTHAHALIDSARACEHVSTARTHVLMDMREKTRERLVQVCSRSCRPGHMVSAIMPCCYDIASVNHDVPELLSTC